MKKFICIACLILVYQTIFAQENSQRIKSEIKSIVIYLSGAELTHSETVNLPAGRSSVVFEGLTPKLLQQSVQVTVSDNVSVLAISANINYLNKIEEKPRIKLIKDSLVLVNSKITALTDERSAFEIEKEMLLKNTSLGGTNSGVSVAEIKLAADFYRMRIKEINSKTSEIDVKLIEFKATKERLNNELVELNANLSYSRYEVSILLSAKSTISATIDLKYLVSDAGWSAGYDITATEINQPVKLNYRAKVFNNTDIDWENIKLKLSTADPTLSAAKPEMKPWYLSYSPSYSNSAGYENQNINKFSNQAPIQADDEYKTKEKKKDEITVDKNTFTEIEVSELSAEFDIATRYSIPSNNKPYLVDVAEYNLPAIYRHYAIPKVDKDAFLIAQITGWEDLNLVEGPANIYFAGTYVGESYIYTRDVKDTLDLSLGRDKKVLITRNKLTNFSSTTFIGNKQKQTLAYEMIVKNNRKQPIQIDIIDQLPVSQNSEIDVDILEISKANHDLLSGLLTWKLTVDAGQSQKINLSYCIKSPKNKAINTQQIQKRYMRKF